MNLFDFNRRDSNESKPEKEEGKLEILRNLDEKIAEAINRVKALKEEKQTLERRVQELEAIVNEKNEEIERLRSEKVAVKAQIEDLLREIESLEIH
jgi:chromosome segregation ATPase